MTELQAELLIRQLARIEKLEERVEALKAALREIVKETSYNSAPIKTPQPLDDIWLIATAALAPETDK